MSKPDALDRNYRDQVIELMAADLAEADATKAVLVDLAADLAFENVLLRTLLEGQLVSRIHGDGTIRTQRRVLARYTRRT
jgi:hypothetical protein